VPMIALLTQRSWAAATYLDFLVHAGPVTMSIIALMLWVKSRGWFRPQDAKVMSWEGAVFTFARWPWSLLGLAAGAYAVLTRRGLDFRVTPKGGGAASRLQSAWSYPTSPYRRRAPCPPLSPLIRALRGLLCLRTA
jgi:cellulose synthase (UDP-forming)